MITTIMKMALRNISKIIIALSVAFIGTCGGYAQMPVLFSMEKVNDNIYIDATEINVGSWLSYYNWVLIHEGYMNACKVLPDSSLVEPNVWEYINLKSGDYIETEARYTGQPIGYFKKISKERDIQDKGDGSNGYDIYDLPIVGVSYLQVVDFCKWRTKIKGKGQYLFRLPTESEWINYCKTHVESYDKNFRMTDSTTNNGKCPTYNYRYKKCQNEDVISPIGSFVGDKNNVFDMFGNVSEMVEEKGIAKGGNYMLYASQCHVDSVQYYTKPEKWLGFRCIAIKLSKNESEKGLEGNAYKTQEVNSSDTLNSKYGVYVDKRDGNIYPTVKIEDNVWFSKNLAFKPKEGKYWAYSNNKETVENQGYLYTWEVATKVCPDGWQLPTKEDFEQLINLYGDSAYVELRPGGGSGFCAYSTGMRYGINFTKSGDCAVFWSLTEKGKRTVWGLGIGGLPPVVKLYGTYSKGSGLPVRCIKNVE